MCASSFQKGLIAATVLSPDTPFSRPNRHRRSKGSTGFPPTEWDGRTPASSGAIFAGAGTACRWSHDPAHRYVPNATGAQPSYRIADLTNRNPKPWVKEAMKKDNDEVLAGKIAFTASSSCMPAGVPGFMGYGGATPLYFVQTPKEVWLIFTMDHQVRRVYMDVPQKISSRPGMASRSGVMKETR